MALGLEISHSTVESLVISEFLRIDPSDLIAFGNTFAIRPLSFNFHVGASVRYIGTPQLPDSVQLHATASNFKFYGVIL